MVRRTEDNARDTIDKVRWSERDAKILHSRFYQNTQTEKSEY